MCDVYFVLTMITSIFSVLSVLCVLFLIYQRKPGFVVLDAHVVISKYGFPILSLTLSFKGAPVSYVNPMIYVKSSKGLYKASLFSGSSIPEKSERISVREIPDEIKVEKILPYRLGIFTMNIFYPTEVNRKNKTYLYVSKKHGKTKKIRLKYKLR